MHRTKINQFHLPLSGDHDVLGFQTEQDCERFRDYVVREAHGRAEGDRLHCFGRTVTVRAFPIGIDVGAFREMTRTAEARRTIRRMRQRNLGRAQIIGVDRLDYSKGLPERYRAFQKLLEQYPETQGRVVLMQIAQPTREAVEAYSDLRQELEWLSGAINGAFGDFEWTPIRSIHRSVPRSTLAALFAASRIGLVTPLRDGMNLVAKEYVAAQDPEDPGVLILSRFAGAAEMMTSALLVNPYNEEEMANALQTALQMSQDERVERHRDLMRVNEETAAGGSPGPAASVLKIAGADARQALDKLWLQTVGLNGVPLQPEALVPGNNVGSLVPDHALTAMATWLDDRSTTIAGGSAEVQRSIVAKAVLGL